jgi:diaminopimelate decarboxylase
MSLSERSLPFDQETFEAIADQYGTPLYVYDEAGIRSNAKSLNDAFSWNSDHTNFFAVKATPTPEILRVVHDEGMGFDCSSRPELTMVQSEGLAANGVFYTSNNTPDDDYRLAREIGATINVDKAPYVGQVARALGALPSRMAIRYNPGAKKTGNDIIGDPIKSKFGDTEEHVLSALVEMYQGGVEEIGLHAMVVSNETDPESFASTARLLRELSERALVEVGVAINFINIGGGIGINYHSSERPVDVKAIGDAVASELQQLQIPIYTENGRYVTGPHGYWLTRVTHGIVESYEPYLQVDTSINNMARLGTVKGAYHDIVVLGREDDPTRVMNVTGSMCANSDVFFRDRELPRTTQPGDLVVIRDAGAHSRANTHNYNSRLRAGEALVRLDGSHQMIRRHETMDDLFATTRGL